MRPSRVPLHLALASAIAVAATVGHAAPASSQADAQLRIGDAERALQRAALERDFASDSRESALLEQARDDLSAALDGTDGVQRDRVSDLLGDVERTIERSAVAAGPVGDDADAVPPPAPSRNQLAELATEAQDLVRDAPTIRRALDVAVIGASPSRETTDAASPAASPNPLRVANDDAFNWPMPDQVPWPQVRIQF